MASIVFIQTDEAGIPYSTNGAAAARGFEYLGYEVRWFRPTELAQLPLTPETVVVGGVATIFGALDKLGAQQPGHQTIPAVLEPYLRRRYWRTTPAEVREAATYPVFLKPYEDGKAFNGQVIRNEDELDRLILPRVGFPLVTEEYPLLAQEVVDFISEWRAFVLRGQVVGLSHYHGDPLTLPAPNIIRMVIGAYRPAPAGYAADFGVTDTGTTLLVEVNDGHSLGHGGLLASLYAELLLARWQEMTTIRELGTTLCP